MNSRRPTIFDVAQHAGVSTATVSRTLNAHPSVDPATRSKVLQSVDALGFVPRSEAVSRARRSTRRVGVTAPFTAHSSFWRVMNGVIGAYRGTGVELSVFDQPSAVTSPNPALAALPVTDRVDGLLVMGIPLDDAVAARIIEAGLPVVLFETERDGFSTVMIDNVREGRAAGRVMAERRPAAVGYLGSRQLSDDYVFSSRLRESGAREAIESAGIPFDDVVEVREGSDDLDAVATAMLERHRDAPFGVIAYHDGLAAAVLRAAATLGLRVPEDVAVVGFDDSELARTLDLTSLHVPFEEAGEAAARLLSEQIGGERTPRRIQLESTVVRRRSA